MIKYDVWIRITAGQYAWLAVAGQRVGVVPFLVMILLSAA